MMNNLGVKTTCSRYSLSIYLIAAYSALVPLENIWVASVGGSVNKYIGLAIMGLMLIKNLQTGRLVTRFSDLWGLYLFFLFAMISNVYAFNVAGWNSGSIVLNMVIFTVLLFQRKYTEQEYRFIIFCTILVSAVLSIMVIFGVGLQTMTLSSVNRATLSINGHSIDQNNLAVSLAIPGVCAFDMLWNSRSENNKLIYIVSIALAVFAIFMTGSRGGVMAFIGSILIYVLFSKGNTKWRLLIIIPVAAALLPIVLETFVPADIAARFSLESILQSGGTGRTKIWLDAFNIYSSSSFWNIMFGYGFGTFPYVMLSFTGWGKAAHNDFVQILLELGVVGISAYISMWFSFYKKTKSNTSPLPVALVACVIIASLSMEMLIKKMFWNALFLAIAYSNLQDKKTE